MWRLTSPSLPATAPFLNAAAPIARIKSGDRELPPIARIHYADSEAMELPSPLYQGVCYSIELPLIPKSIVSVAADNTPLTKVSNASRAIPGNYWKQKIAEKHVINLYAHQAASELRVRVAATIYTPPANSDYLHSVRLDSKWGTLEVVNVISEGLPFYPATNPSNLVAHDFLYSGGFLYLQASENCAPRLTGTVELTVDLIYAIEPICDLATFNLAALELLACDRVDYLGRTYLIADPALPPVSGNLYWSSATKLATVCLW